MRNRMPWCVGDLVVGIALLTMVGGAVFVAAQHAREINNRVKCASNLRQIGQAILLYANENKGAYPRTILKAANEVKPTWGTPYEGNGDLIGAAPDNNSANPFVKNDDPNVKYRPADNDVTAALYLLLRTQDITSEVFICPSSGIKKWDFGGGAMTAMNWTNWAGNEVIAQHLSYSYQNPYPSPSAVAAGFKLNTTVAADYAVLADMNPGGDAVLKVTINSPENQMRAANSLNHRRDGQNVLYGDGHVEFPNNPFCGTQRDNIYTANGPEVKEQERKGDAVILASPVSFTDSILLPTAADVGFEGPPEPKPLMPAEVEQLKALFPGQYRLRRGHMTIDANTITVVAGPTTTKYAYKLLDADENGLTVELSAPDWPTRKVNAMVRPEGVAFDRGTDPSMDGSWARVK